MEFNDFGAVGLWVSNTLASKIFPQVGMMDDFWFVTRTVREEITVRISRVPFVAVLLVFGDSAGLLRVVTSAWQLFDVFQLVLGCPSSQ